MTPETRVDGMRARRVTDHGGRSGGTGHGARDGDDRDMMRTRRSARRNRGVGAVAGAQREAGLWWGETDAGVAHV